jgi:hypothetical protein
MATGITPGIVCECCGADAVYNIWLCEQDGRFYIPNQSVRAEWPEMMRSVPFCHPCMHAIEDALRATIERRKIKVEIETFHPEAMGWIRKGSDEQGNQIYERPDGKLHVFPPRQLPRIATMMQALPKWRSGKEE